MDSEPHFIRLKYPAPCDRCGGAIQAGEWAAVGSGDKLGYIRTDRLEIHVPANASGELLNCIRRIVCHAL